MDKELALRTFAYLIGHYKTHDETIINSQEIEAIEFMLKNNEDLEQQCQKQKEAIDKAIKLIKYNEKYRDGAGCCQFVDIVSEILDPLQSILEKDETTNNAYLKEFEDWLKEVSE